MLITILTPTNRLKNSLDFYHRLGFTRISEQPILFTDGKALIEIDPDRFARAGLKIYSEHMMEVTEALTALTSMTKTESGYLCSDPSGVRIYLVDGIPDVQFSQVETSFSVLGNSAGLSLETTDMDRSMKFYQTLGFTKTGGNENGGYVTLHLHGLDISLMRSLMCPHLFFNPSLTYFNSGKNLQVIERIRALEIPIAEEITYFNKEGLVDNVIIRDPGGYGFFVFND